MGHKEIGGDNHSFKYSGSGANLFVSPSIEKIAVMRKSGVLIRMLPSQS